MKTAYLKLSSGLLVFLNDKWKFFPCKTRKILQSWTLKPKVLTKQKKNFHDFIFVFISFFTIENFLFLCFKYTFFIIIIISIVKIIAIIMTII